MTMKKILILAAGVWAIATNVQAADLAAGKKIADATCAACHGQDGKSPVDLSYPKLAGQHADYLEKALNDYKSGARKNPIMGGMAKPLSKADIQNVSAYFESLPGDLSHRK